MAEKHEREIQRAFDELGRAPVDYERTASEFRRLVARDRERITEFRLPAKNDRAETLAGLSVFMVACLIGAFLILVFTGCSTAPLAKIGETCTGMTDKGVLISRPCASNLRE